MRTALCIIAVLFLAGCTEVPVTKNGTAKATGSGAETVKKTPAGKYKAAPRSKVKTTVDANGKKSTNAQAFATGAETKIP